MEHELDLLDHLNDTVTRITEDTLLLSLLLDYMDGLSCRPEQVSREISENLLQRLGDSLEQDAGALRRLWQSYGVSGRSRAYIHMPQRMTPSRAKPAFSSTRREPALWAKGSA